MTSSRDPEVLVRPDAQLHGVDVVVGAPSKVLELIRGREWDHNPNEQPRRKVNVCELQMGLAEVGPSWTRRTFSSVRAFPRLFSYQEDLGGGQRSSIKGVWEKTGAKVRRRDGRGHEWRKANGCHHHFNNRAVLTVG